MQLRILSIIVFLLQPFISYSQHPIVTIQNTAEQEIVFDQISYLPAGDSVKNYQSALQSAAAGRFIPNTKKYLNLGIATDDYWVFFTIANPAGKALRRVLNLGNPRINEADIYIVNAREQTEVFKIGDHYPFYDRPLQSNQFAVPFQIAPNDTLQFLMLIRHKGNTLQLPLSINTENSFLVYTENNYLVTGIASGVIILTLFFSLFLYVRSYNRLYIFYAIYLFSILSWLFATEGYGFQYFWPGQLGLETRLGPGFSVFNLCFFIAVALLFTKPYDQTRWVRNILKGFVVFIFLWGLQAFMPYIDVENPVLTSFFLKASFLIYAVSLATTLGYLLYVSVKKNRIVLFYLFSVITSIVFTVMIILKHSGVMNLPFTSGVFASIGVVLEIVLMTIGIANQFYSYKKEKEILLTEYLAQQKSITEKILVMQEAERKRISREMHDDIGAGLTQIALISESVKNKSGNSGNTQLADITEISRKLVSNMSEIIWTMQPENKTLPQLWIYMREQLNKQLEYAGIDYKISLPESDAATVLSNEQLRNILLVTKEIVNNAIKHSGASVIQISVIQKDRQLEFLVSDNGKGFDPGSHTTGNGLRNIRSRIAELGGQLDIIAGPGDGASFAYTIPTGSTT